MSRHRLSLSRYGPVLRLCFAGREPRESGAGTAEAGAAPEGAQSAAARDRRGEENARAEEKGEG